MKKVAVVILAFALVMFASGVAPAMAIGPVKPLENGNPRFSGNAATGFVQKDSAENTFMWITSTGMIFHDVMKTTGEGRMNNAAIVDVAFLMTMGDPEATSNKWYFLSGDNTQAHPNINQWNNPYDNPDAGSHGMLYWFAEFAFGPGSGAPVAASHPDGVFATWHIVGK